MPRSGQKTGQWRPDEYGTDKYLLGTGSGIASGAEAGSAFGPWGALVGGIIGGGVGAAQTAEQDKAAQDAQMQQHALEQDLKSTDVYDRMAQATALQGQQARQRAVLDARQAAARAGMTPAAAAEFERQAGLQVDAAMAAQRPSDFLAAQQADLARRQQVLQEYNAAQGLANDAAPTDYSQLWGGLMQAANTYGSMNKTGGTVNAAAPQPASAVSNEQAMSVPAATAARTDAPLAGVTGQPAGNAPVAVPTGAAPTTAAPQTPPVPTGAGTAPNGVPKLVQAVSKPGTLAKMDRASALEMGVSPTIYDNKDNPDFMAAYNGEPAQQANVVPTAPDMMRPQPWASGLTLEQTPTIQTDVIPAGSSLQAYRVGGGDQVIYKVAPTPVIESWNSARQGRVAEREAAFRQFISSGGEARARQAGKTTEYQFAAEYPQYGAL